MKARISMKRAIEEQLNAK